jgi:hypothetical protein
MLCIPDHPHFINNQQKYSALSFQGAASGAQRRINTVQHFISHLNFE